MKAVAWSLILLPVTILSTVLGWAVRFFEGLTIGAPTTPMPFLEMVDVARDDGLTR